MKKTVLLLCGGYSEEHQVSLRSGLSVIAQFPTERFNLLPVVVDRCGGWWTGDPLVSDLEDPKKIKISPNLRPVSLKNKQVDGQVIDCVFSVLHGQFGEDGCMQGLFEMAGIPQVGSGVLGSAMAMDKDVTKRLVMFEGINTAPYLCLRSTDQGFPSYAEATKKLGGTLFIKPASQGSSVGISKATDEVSYQQGIKLAFQFDRKVLVEQAIVGREIELAVLGNHHPVVSVPGEIKVTEDFYSYEAKYILENTGLEIPAELPESTTTALQEAATQVFTCLELSGLARVDFFLDEQSQIWLNEPNSLPGFTSISMYAKLFEASGIAYPELLTRLVELALEKHAPQAASPSDTSL